MKAITRALLVTLVLVATGCSGGQPIQVWQTSVEQYIGDEANNDPSALRNVAERPSHREFGVIGAASSGMPVLSSSRTDVTGVLVGHRSIDARWWFVFLVGSVTYHGNGVVFPVDDPTVDSIRVAAMSTDGHDYEWVVGEDDPTALATYCEAQLAAWRRSHESRSDAESGPTEFPTAGDALRMAVDGSQVTVFDDRTGASWTLNIPPVAAAGAADGVLPSSQATLVR